MSRNDAIQQVYWLYYYNTEVLRADHCDYNNAYILIRGDIFVRAAGGA